MPGSSTADKDSIFVAGVDKMAMYAKLPGATNSVFYPLGCPEGAAGQGLDVRLFDVGDSSKNGTITILLPAESPVTFTDCKATGAVTATLPTCSFTVTQANNNGGQNIAVSIPSTFTRNDLISTNCWVKLSYAYGPGAQRGPPGHDVLDGHHRG